MSATIGPIISSRLSVLNIGAAQSTPKHFYLVCACVDACSLSSISLPWTSPKADSALLQPHLTAWRHHSSLWGGGWGASSITRRIRIPVIPVTHPGRFCWAEFLLSLAGIWKSNMMPTESPPPLFPTWTTLAGATGHTTLKWQAHIGSE